MAYKKLVPEAKQAMENFNNEIASEVGVTLKNGYNGELTARQAGAIGGNMVKKMIEKAKQDLNYKPKITLEEGIKKYAEDIKKQSK